MSNSIEIKGFITLTKYEWSDKPYYNFIPSATDPSDCLSDGTVVIAQHTIRLALPENLDLTALRLKKLLIQKEKVRAEFSKRLAEIEDSINKLTCLENNV
jgi:hypothetical protein